MGDTNNAEQVKQHFDFIDHFMKRFPHLFCPTGNSHCPMHEDKNPSFQLFHDHGYCHSEGKSYDVIDLEMKYAGISFKEALVSLAEQAGLNPGSGLMSNGRARDRNRTANSSQQSPDFRERYASYLKSPVPPEAIVYLTETRKLSKRDVHVLLEKKLVAWSVKGASLVFPITSADGETLLGLQYLPINGGQKKFAKGTKSGQGFFRFCDGAPDSFVVCEGIFDALSVSSALEGVEVCAILSASTVDKLKLLSGLPGPPILCFDRDAAGQKAAAKAARLLGPRKCAIVDWSRAPEGCKDPNDLLKSGNENVLRAMVRESRLYEPPVDSNASDEEAASNGDVARSLLDEKGRLKKHKGAAQALSSCFDGELLYRGLTGQWMAYDGAIWKSTTEHQAAAIVDRRISESAPFLDYNVSWRDGVMNQLSLYLLWEDHEPPKDAIPFKNCVLFLDDMRFEPHRKDYWFTWQLPFDYSPDAGCESVKKWLLEATGDSQQVELLRAFLNAILTGRADLHRYLELIGPGGSGKGTFIRLCCAIAGRENVHVTELKRLEKNRFETAPLFGKRLCTITDAERYGGDVALLKAMTGGDDLPYEEKHKQNGRQFRFNGMVVIAANEPIANGDYTSGLQRRRMTVKFGNVVSSERRRDLETEFAPYLAGVITWALEMPRDRVTALVRDTDKEVRTLAGVGLETLVNTNPIAAWADDCLIYSTERETFIGRKEIDPRTREILNADTDLYPSYSKWCDESGHKGVAVNRFVPLLEDLLSHQLKLPGVLRRRDRRGSRFVGIGIRRSGSEESSPLMAFFRIGKAESVTGGDGSVTDEVTDQTRMVTNVTDFVQHTSIENKQLIEGTENPTSPASGMDGKNGGKVFVPESPSPQSPCGFGPSQTRHAPVTGDGLRPVKHSEEVF